MKNFELASIGIAMLLGIIGILLLFVGSFKNLNYGPNNGNKEYVGKKYTDIVLLIYNIVPKVAPYTDLWPNVKKEYVDMKIIAKDLNLNYVPIVLLKIGKDNDLAKQIKDNNIKYVFDGKYYYINLKDIIPRLKPLLSEWENKLKKGYEYKEVKANNTLYVKYLLDKINKDSNKLIFIIPKFSKENEYIDKNAPMIYIYTPRELSMSTIDYLIRFPVFYRIPPSNVVIKDSNEFKVEFKLEVDENLKKIIKNQLKEYYSFFDINYSDNKVTITLKDGNIKKVYLFVMSFCPFGNKMEEFLYEFKQKCKLFDFEPVFIVDKTNKGFSSLHGPDEVIEDALERRIINEKGVDYWLEFVQKANQFHSSKEIMENLGVKDYNVSDLEYDYNLTKKFKVGGSPTIVIETDKDIIKIEGMLPKNFLRDLFNLYGLTNCNYDFQEEGVKGRC